MNKLTTNKFIQKAKDIHGDKYDYSLVEYINSRVKVKIICKIHGVFEQTPVKHLNLKRGCQICGGSKKSNTKIFIEKSKKLHNNKYNYSLVNYTNVNTKVKIICPEHGIFEQLPNNHLIKKYGCPSCSGNKKSDTIDFIKRSIKVHDNKYNYSLVNYVNAHTKVEIICPTHGVFNQSPNSHIQNIGCPFCNESKGEKQILKFLLNNNIIFTRQYRFNRCRDKRTLPFDFYLNNHNICLEYDGRQHFDLTNGFWGGEKASKLIKNHDNIKTNFCKENNITLYRINYKENIIRKLNEIYESIKKI